MSVPPPAEPVAVAPKPVDLDDIERALADLWRRPTVASPEARAHETVTRACMSNLLIFCTTPAAASRISQDVARIVREHPARILLFVEDAQRPPAEIGAYVSAQCYLADGGRQICSEHVTVNAGPGAARRLPSVARPLLVGDLPTALWWVTADAPPLHGELFDEFAAMANQVIYDSGAWHDAARGGDARDVVARDVVARGVVARGVVATADWVRREAVDRVIADLAWRRIKPWRRLLSASLDPARAAGALEAIREVVVEHGPHALPEAWLLIGWLACCLGWRPAGGAIVPGIDLTWAFQAPHGPVGVTIQRRADGDTELHSVSIDWSAGRLHANVVQPRRLAVRMNGDSTPVSVVANPPRSRAALLARQLPALTRDPLFLDTLDIARIMAETML